MPYIAVNNAKLRCDKGTTPAPIKVSSQNSVTIKEQYVATEKDNQPNTNIPSFGYCAVQRKTCNPVPQAWQQTCKKDSINGMKELTKDSYCMCSCGGKISFIDSGDNNFVSVD